MIGVWIRSAVAVVVFAFGILAHGSDHGMMRWEQEQQRQRLVTVRSIGNVSYEGRRATRLRRFPTVPDRLFLTARNGGLYVWNVSDPPHPTILASNMIDDCLEGQDMSHDGKYLAIVSPCSATLRVARSDDLGVIASIVLWPSSGALHVRWLNNTILIVSNPGRRWDNLMNRWIDEQPSEIEDGLIVLRFENDALTVEAHISPGNVNGTESLTLLHPHSFVLIGGFRATNLDLIDLTDPTRPRLADSVSDSSYQQMVGTYDDGLAYLGMWGRPGGLAVFSIEHNRTIRHVRSLLLDELSSANRVKLALRSRLAFIPLETSDGGGFGIVDVSDVSNLSMACDVIAVKGASANDTTYSLEVDATEQYVYVAPTDGLLRVYAVEETSAR